MADRVWLSKAIPDPQLIQRVDTDIWVGNQQAAIAAGKLGRKGQPVSADMCPNRIWGADNAKPFKSMPDLFSAQSHWIVSEKAADIIARFDMGGGALYPVAEGIYQKDNATPVPGNFFTWIFGNARQGFLEQYSPAAKPMSGSDLRDWCTIPWDLADDDIAVSSAALEGPDVWVDPALFQSIFLSGRLGDALDAAGLRHAFRLFSCRVV